MLRKETLLFLVLSIILIPAYAQYQTVVEAGHEALSNAYKREMMRQKMIRMQMENEQLKKQYQQQEEEYRRQQQIQQINNYIQQLSISASQGNAESQYLLGNLHFNGKFVQQNSQAAVYWWEKAAIQGHSLAQSSLGYAYFSGTGIRQDYKKSVYWRTKAATQ